MTKANIFASKASKLSAGARVLRGTNEYQNDYILHEYFCIREGVKNIHRGGPLFLGGLLTIFPIFRGGTDHF